MLDFKYLRHNPETVAKQLATRGYSLDIETLKQLEIQRKAYQAEAQALQYRANTLAKQLGQAKLGLIKTDATSELMEDSRKTKSKLLQAEAALQATQTTIETLLHNLPNLPHSTTPMGSSAKENVVIRSWGEPKNFDFIPKDHMALSGKAMDFESAAKITGSRFVVLHSRLARLHRALIQFMLDIHTQAGYEEVYVPYLVNAKTLHGTGQLPLFNEDLFQLKDSEFYLIPTAEVPVTNLARDQIFNADQLPKKYVCHTPCFRSEAGAYGKDVRGMMRQHQFEKVELVHLETAATAEQALEKLTQQAEIVLQKLALPYQVVSLCTGDLGFASCKTYDLEVWLPSQSTFREIASCSHMGDFQARRMKARWRPSNAKQTEYIHTLNGSGLAIGRTLIAILENYQDAQGQVHIPKALQPYMGKDTQLIL